MSYAAEASARARTLIDVAMADAGPDLPKRVQALEKIVFSLCKQHQVALALMLPKDTKGTEYEVSVRVTGCPEPLIAHVNLIDDTAKVNAVYLRGLDIFHMLTQALIESIAAEARHTIKRRHCVAVRLSLPKAEPCAA